MRRMARQYGMALVTGATSGIGEAFARALPPSTGLLLTGRDTDALARLEQELSADGRAVQTVRADLETDAGLDAVAAAAEAAGIDLFVCNAGQGPLGTFLDAEEAALRATVSVNVMAPTVLLRRLLPGMIARAQDGRGTAGVVVVSSNTGFLPVPMLAAYAASKAFDLSLGESLAAELAAEPIDVLTLCPTATRSNFAARAGLRTGMPPGAQSPGHVARAALRALGRQSTLVLGPVSGSVLSLPALVRAAAARGLWGAGRMMRRD